MGCGKSSPQAQPPPAQQPQNPPRGGGGGGAGYEPKPKPKPKPKAGGGAAGGGAKPPAGGGGGANKDDGGDPEYTKTLGSFEPLFCTLQVGKDKNCYACCVKSKDEKGVEFGCVLASQDTFTAALSEAELNAKREKTGCTWTKLFAALKNSFSVTRKVTCKDSNPANTLTLQIPIDGGRSPLTIQLKTAGREGINVHRLFLEPLCAYAVKKRASKEDEKVQKIEAEIGVKNGQQVEHGQKLASLTAEVKPLAESTKSAQEDARAAKDQCDMVSKRIAKLKNPQKGSEDHLYPAGAYRYVLHTTHAKEHIPTPVSPNLNAMHLVKQKYNGDTSNAPPNADNNSHKEILTVLEKIDEWDYDVFALQEHTNGGSLFMTTYTLLYKYGLVQHYNIDEKVLTNFLSAVQSGYHPNPYHNSTHAADVLQITHYIMKPGGMADAISMTKEDQLAALLSAAIHDYDHPGFNNNFHCRTQAYLATLYNDRSVLENHHLAQVFEIMKNPDYNVLQSLSDDQKKDVRDTMIEMVLSTDMGNHAKIFQAFRKRLNEAPEWTKKEDQRLALSIAIKMADISNCGRPQQLYLGWAKKIAEEFYNQGDVENNLKYTISPFMDRRRDKTDFPKGQISFMNYIVIPLFEAGAQFLSKLEFTVGKIQANKEYWQHKQDE
eukprot:TRINITY_DN67850_c5_g1_i2.p2 TRINITY_DN67850_c5_g1~~TRINITY_DN67850_c5_g1_i2.p2  ORF type:complete len:661 (-),score=110.46 TRINITY_DN67850_c5_g1_i2:2994-4976(-)